eukprot:Rmarinus@m.2852
MGFFIFHVVIVFSLEYGTVWRSLSQDGLLQLISMRTFWGVDSTMYYISLHCACVCLNDVYVLLQITDFTQVCDDWNITELEEGETKHVLRLVEGILELHTSCLNGLRDLIRKNEYFLGDEPGRLLFWQRLRSPTSRHCHLHIPPFWDAHWGGTVATAHDFQRVFVGEIEEALEKKRVDPKKTEEGPQPADVN